MEELHYWSACRLAQKIQAKELSPLESYEHIKNRIEQFNPTLNAYCTLGLEEAKKAATLAEKQMMRGDELGPLHGVPIAIKDDISVGQMRFTAGSRLAANRIGVQDHMVVQRLREAGAIILGKTNMSEFGHKAVTDNDLFGITRNPWNLDRTPGGSSGGSACAVAAGMAYLATGGDFGGSIRVPAALCGIVGHKPSLGRVPNFQPGADLLETAYAIGPIGRSVQDVALMLNVMSGPTEKDPYSLQSMETLEDFKSLEGLRVAWCPSPTGGPVVPQIIEAALKSVNSLSELGVEVELLEMEFTPPIEALLTLGAGAYIGLKEALENTPDMLSKTCVHQLENVFKIRDTTLEDYMNARIRTSAFIEQTAQIFERYDLIASPTVAAPACSVDLDFGPEEINSVPIDPFTGWLFTWPFNLTGHPALSLPCGWDENRTGYGLQLVGKRGEDALVLKMAMAIGEKTKALVRHPNLTE